MTLWNNSNNKRFRIIRNLKAMIYSAMNKTTYQVCRSRPSMINRASNRNTAITEIKISIFSIIRIIAKNLLNEARNRILLKSGLATIDCRKMIFSIRTLWLNRLRRPYPDKIIFSAIKKKSKIKICKNRDFNASIKVNFLI